MRLQRLPLRSRGTDLFASEATVYRLATAQPAPQNAAPQGTNKTITATEDVLYVFSQSDFGFSDSDGHSFAGVFVTTAPGQGNLGVNGSAIGAGNFVSAETIAAGQFFFEAGLNANGSNFAAFTFQVRDSSGAEDASPNTITVNVLAVNDPPLYRNFNSGSAGTFNEGQPTPLRLDQMGNGEVDDIDSTDFSGGWLKVSIVAGGTSSEDVLGIANAGAVSVSDTEAGSTVSVGGVVIGTIVGGGTGFSEDLIVQFNDAATADRVELLVRALTYLNIAENPSADSRLVRISLNDGDGPEIGSTDVNVHIMGFNDAPALSDPTASQLAYLPGDPLIPLWAGVTMTDPDNQPNFVGGSLSMNIGGSDTRVELMGTRFSINNAGFLVDNSTGQALASITIFRGSVQTGNFTNAVTAEVANALIHAFGFRAEGASPALGNYDAGLTFSDGTYMFGGSLASNMVHQTITVGNPSTEPVVDLNGSGPGLDSQAFYTEDGPPVGLAMGNLLVLDANAGNQLDKMVLSLSDPQATDVLTWGALPSGIAVMIEEIDFRRVITFSGPATPLAYQNLLGSVRYSTTDDTPVANRSIDVYVQSDAVQSAVAHASISIRETDDLGVAQDDLLLAGKTGLFSGNVGFDNGFGTDQDPDAFNLIAVNGAAANVNQTLTLASGATLFISSGGGISFDPKTAYPAGGVETFTYTILGNTTATATIVIGATGPGMIGTSGPDALNGTANADAMMGQAGSDYLRGGAGDDFLIGGLGNDVLEGGAGADHFVFTAAADSRTLALRSDGHKHLPDTIVDFAQGSDKIDLGAIDAIAGTAANDAFAFIGSGAFTHQAGQLRFETGGGRTSIFADLDGDGSADMQILLLAPVALTAGDFIL
jgi:hypothetical protein